jgi:hypothetical protein
MRTTRPVNISPQVEALTNTESLWPRWRFQFPAEILSRISASWVSSSGGNSEQRLGDAHEHHPFLGREPVLVKKGIEATFGPRAYRLDQFARGGCDAIAGLGIEFELAQELANRLRLVGAIVRVNAAAQQAALGEWVLENHSLAVHCVIYIVPFFPPPDRARAGPPRAPREGRPISS